MKNIKAQEKSGSQLAATLPGDRQQPQLFSSLELFGNNNEIMICHKGEIYRIKITRNDKLIMNK